MDTNSTRSALESPSHPVSVPAAHPTLVLFSFAAVYVLWGSTYLAIRVGVESFPPFLLAGLRHLSIGLVFYPTFRAVTREKPTYVQWRSTFITGCLLLLVGNGTVSWAEQIVPSGIAALLVATVSLWMVLMDWLRPGGSRPAPRVLAGFLLGFAGLALLVGPKHLGNSERINPIGACALIGASLAWAAGSIYSRHHPLPRSPMLGVAMQTLCGGTALCVVAFLTGELRHFHLADVTLRSWLALFYLIVFGSALGFSAYVYILKHSTAARVATYAFVNPVVALFLGWFLAAEPLTLRTLLASLVILTAVLLVITVPHKDLAEADESVPAPGEA
ncbi:MAG TPA: EamA family transporter [Candidatus Limnocylindrales bacterium]|nr:EamA family transporter [Candidatus Limnocylindrales bacterium]